MKRMAAIIWHGFSIWLLLFATAIPPVDGCLPRLLSEGQKEEKEEKGSLIEEQLAKEAVVHRARCHRGDARRLQLLGVPLQALGQRSRGNSWIGQVCVSDGLRGEQRLAHGCGAVLLR